MQYQFVSRDFLAFELNPGTRRQSTVCSDIIATLARHPTLGQQLGDQASCPTAARQTRPLKSKSNPISNDQPH
jgi:hypothetical protein